MSVPVNEAPFKEINSAVNQDWKALKVHLSEMGHYLELSEPPRQFAAGFGNLNYYIIFDGRPAVLRRPPMSILVPGANDMLREAKVLKALHPVFPLVPKLSLIHISEPTRPY